MDINAIIAGLRAENDQRIAAMRAALEAAQTRDEGSRSLTEIERAAHTAHETAVTANNERIAELTAQRDREAAAAAANLELAGRAPTVVVGEQGPYTADSSRNGGNSYFRDLWRSGKGDRDAIDRLVRNNAHRIANTTNVEERAITTGLGAGGEFVPPLWLEQQFVPLARPGRATADLTNKDKLPEGTNSINIPRLTGGTAVAAQTTQNTAVQQTDITTDSIASSVYTLAGGQTIALQLIEQSPLNIDKMVLGDLAKAYGIGVDAWTIAGTGTGQPRGILNVSGINSIAITGASAPTLGGSGALALYPKLAQAIALIQTTRFDVPSAWVMHPLRWYWILAQSDTQNRPMVVPNTQGPMNSMATISGNEVQGVVGYLMGLPVVVDPNMPLNLGAGTNQDAIVLAKWDDILLWEGSVRAQAFEQTFANQISLLVRLYNYVSFQAARYPKAISVITGTAFAQSLLTF